VQVCNAKMRSLQIRGVKRLLGGRQRSSTTTNEGGQAFPSCAQLGARSFDVIANKSAMTKCLISGICRGDSEHHVPCLYSRAANLVGFGLEISKLSAARNRRR
jgi:hypothetical protein